MRLLLLLLIASRRAVSFSTAPHYCRYAHNINSQTSSSTHSQLEATRSRREILVATALVPALPVLTSLQRAHAATDDPTVTDKIYLTVKGLPDQPPDGARLEIGLFGKEAPDATNRLLQLCRTTTGLPAPCRPRAERTLQKEQLEANKVYNSCKEMEEEGVRLKYSTVWRIQKDLLVDVGAVTGKYVSREYPTWSDQNDVPFDHFGLVCVYKGNTSGFGLSIFTGTTDQTRTLSSDYVVVGKVLSGLDVVEQLNNAPVINSSKVNYMGLTGGPKQSNAPDRSCRYGGPMYCNENKPLTKLTLTDTGVL